MPFPVDRPGLHAIWLGPALIGCCQCGAAQQKLERVLIAAPPIAQARRVEVEGEIWLLTCARCGTVATDAMSRANAAYELEKQGQPVEAARTSYSGLFCFDRERLDFGTASRSCLKAAQQLLAQGEAERAIGFAEEAASLDACDRAGLPWDHFDSDTQATFDKTSREISDVLAQTQAQLPDRDKAPVSHGPFYPQGHIAPQLECHPFFRAQRSRVRLDAFVAHRKAGGEEVIPPDHDDFLTAATKCFRAGNLLLYCGELGEAAAWAGWCVRFDELYRQGLPWNERGASAKQLFASVEATSRRRRALLQAIQRAQAGRG